MIYTTKYLIPIILLFALAMTATGTMWLNSQPTYMLMGKFYSPVFKPHNQSPIEVVHAPFFPFLGTNSASATNTVATAASTTTYAIETSRSTAMPPMQLTFSGGMENNFRYAQTRSSIKVGSTESPSSDSWTSMNFPWLLT